MSGFEVSNSTCQDPYGTSGYFVSCFLVKLSFIYLFQNALVFTLKLSKITLSELLSFIFSLRSDTSSGTVDHQEFVFNFLISMDFSSAHCHFLSMLS